MCVCMYVCKWPSLQVMPPFSTAQTTTRRSFTARPRHWCRDLRSFGGGLSASARVFSGSISIPLLETTYPRNFSWHLKKWHFFFMFRVKSLHYCIQMLIMLFPGLGINYDVIYIDKAKFSPQLRQDPFHQPLKGGCGILETIMAII